jgi:hypothetical protein
MKVDPGAALSETSAKIDTRRFPPTPAERMTMPRTADALSLTQALGGAQAAPGQARRPRAWLDRRTTAKLALTLGVMATAVSLGVFVGQVARVLMGG